MKAWKTSLFILSVVIMLIAISWVYPNNNITISGFTIKFANQKSITQRYTIPKNDFDPGLVASANGVFTFESKFQKIHQAIIDYVPPKTPLDLLEDQLLAQLGRIYTPQDKCNWFNPLFQHLDSAQTKSMRIMHYGDSQIEEDHITGKFRELIQTKFGGYGVGLLPLYQSIPSTAIAQRINPIPPRFLAYGPKSLRHEEGFYGPMGLSTYINGNYTVSFSKINLKYTSKQTKSWSKITLICGTIEDTLKIKGSMMRKIRPQNNAFITKQFKKKTQYSQLEISGKGTIYGISLDSPTGVQVDNIPMRGCSGTIFRRIHSVSLTPYFKHFNVPLIILQYGGNTVPYIKGTKAITNYCANIEKQIQYLQRCAPHAQFLFIGPSDMSTINNGIRQSYPNLKPLIKELKETCLSNNIAYWNLYEAMGGYNSMIKWVEKGYAGSDYIHFSNKGSTKTGELLFESLMKYYEYYQLQQSIKQSCAKASIKQTQN
ncbi:hypothetical protein N9251_00925 [Gammaproteobacteria bacterium]|nr:hypothetical protein [Gammaproteobacteria bacterium]